LPDGHRWRSEEAGFFRAIDSVNENHEARLAPALRANGNLVRIQWRAVTAGRAVGL
jgi:hypothetical protein